MSGLPEPAGRFGFLDSLWLFPLVAGITGYLSGRSRRGAFISATLGLLLFDIGYYVWLISSGAPLGRVDFGGAGAFDAIVLSGVFAVYWRKQGSTERMAGGSQKPGGRTPSL
jgi:uncharacterized membrane protein